MEIKLKNLKNEITLVDERSMTNSKKNKKLGKLECKFECTSACVELRCATHYDTKPLYRILEYPRTKNAKWHKEIYYEDFHDLAIEKFRHICNFWLK